MWSESQPILQQELQLKHINHQLESFKAQTSNYCYYMISTLPIFRKNNILKEYLRNNLLKFGKVK